MSHITADSELLKFRKLAHEAFDPIWRSLMQQKGKSFKQAKGIAYAWLQRRMGLPPARCHMSSMDIEQCRKVIAVCKLSSP